MIKSQQKRKGSDQSWQATSKLFHSYSNLFIPLMRLISMIIIGSFSMTYIKFKMEKLILQKTISIQIEENPDQEESNGSIDEIELEFQKRKDFRQQRLQTMKHRLQHSTKGRERQRQNKVLYFINLALPFIMSCLNAYNFIKNDQQPELKGILITSFVVIGLFFSLLSNLMLAPWREVLKLYLIFDSVVPVMIASIIGFYSVLHFLEKGVWYQRAYAVDLPLWVIYFAGSLRVTVAFANWSKWQVICYKIVTMSCGLVFFYVGFTFMNGGYKITRGYLVSVQARFRDMTYLYVFGMVEQFFECYRRLSYFDQTEELKDEYTFQAQCEEDQKRIADSEAKKVQQDIMQQQIHDIIATKMITMKRVESKKVSQHLKQVL